MKWYRKAADQGDARAQRNLGICYRFGTGVTKDEVVAVKWYRLAAEQGDDLALRALSSKEFSPSKETLDLLSNHIKESSRNSQNDITNTTNSSKSGDAYPDNRKNQIKRTGRNYPDEPYTPY